MQYEMQSVPEGAPQFAPPAQAVAQAVPVAQQATVQVTTVTVGGPNKCVNITLMVGGIINIVGLILGLLSLTSATPNIGAIIFGLLIGGAGTAAAALYNPCGCCGGPPSSGTLKTSAILAMVCAVVSLVAVIMLCVGMAGVSRFDGYHEYRCCPAGATEVTVSCNEECSSPSGKPKPKYDCWGAGNSIEPETCLNSGEVAIRTGNSYNDPKLIDGTKSVGLIFLGISMAFCATTLIPAPIVAFFNWKEAGEKQNQ